MKKRLQQEITTLFLDVGGVLLTNGWDHHARRRAAKNFKLQWTEMEDRHRLVFETHEEGKITFEEYLGRVVFYKKRPFTRAQFRRFMFAQSKPYSEMLDLVAQLKVRHELKIAVVSNESREVNAYRIRKFKLNGFVDSFISSCFVHIRKPDADIFRLALDIAQTPARHVLYISKTHRCSSRSRKDWGFEAFFTRITSPRAQNWLRSDCRNDEGIIHETSQPTHPDDQWRLVEHQVCTVRGG
jgi:putative hydrolase of the HAD superfamily